MILLSALIETFEADLLEHYQDLLLPSHRQALAAMRQCRTTHSPMMLAACDDCTHQVYVPHSCGHRSCPHCQQHESQQWLERQLKKQVPAEYFLVTFTLPKELRALAWQQQRTLYSLMTRCSWETLKTFTQNDPQLKGGCRRHFRIAHPFPPPRLSPACALRDTGGGHRCEATTVAN